MLSQSTITAVKELPIEEVLAHYITLRKHGSSYQACCPFHNENTPSFNVSPVKGIYKCFGCGKSGRVVDFVMEYQKLDFPAAVRELAALGGIAIEETKASKEDEMQRRRNDDYATVTHGARGHYIQQLHKRPDMLHDLLQERDISLETLIDFQIGYAPDEWKFLTGPIIEKGFYEPAAALGLVRTKEGNSWDFFRHRITIPIVRKDGVCIGFGARKFADGDKENAKYMNSSDCPGFFEKGNTLYGLNVTYAAIRQLEEAYLVEGYWDVISMYEKGIENITASMGTAFTTPQAKLLRKYCDTVIILRDGDKAGHKATLNDIVQCQENNLFPFVLQLPDGYDPDSWARSFSRLYRDSYNDKPLPELANAALLDWCTKERIDGIHYYMDKLITAAGEKVTARSEATEMICRLISQVPNEFARTEYINTAVKEHKLTRKTLDSRIKNLMDERKEELEQKTPEDQMPKWVDINSLYTEGFVQNYNEKADRIGIYFKADGKPPRLTNYVIKPLYQVDDPKFPRRMIEVYNGRRASVVELPAKAFTSMDAFETELVSKGAYYSEIMFGKHHYKRIANWLMDNMPRVYELNTLGWQPEGFFAFSNVCVKDKELLHFDEYGIVNTGDKNFLSSGVSKLNTDFRQEDNVYENDLYLKYEKSPITFEEWAKLFCDVYTEHSAFGIAFVFISAFKDIVVRITKCPGLYFYGQKGSGKSAMGESIMWLFFAGKNAEGKLISGYNLAPGQGTPFSLNSLMQRFRNVPMLLNEHDPATSEPYKKGVIKSHYDNEGRVIGSAETGKKRKVDVQKPQGTIMLAGQYLDTTDDGAILSRFIISNFSLEKSRARTKEQDALWAKLNEYEHHGISSLVANLYQYREHISKNLKDEFWRQQNELTTELRRAGRKIDPRLVSNYSLFQAIINIMAKQIDLPFTPEEFKEQVVARIKEQAAILKENNILNSFWDAIQNLFVADILISGTHFKILHMDEVLLTKEGGREKHRFNETQELLFIRLNTIYDHYAKRFREVSGKTAPSKDTIETYLKDQAYYVGNCPAMHFRDMNTSAIVIQYPALELNLVKDGEAYQAKPKEETPETPKVNNPGVEEELPF